MSSSISRTGRSCYKDVRQFGTMHLFATGKSFSMLLLPSWGMSRWMTRLRSKLSRKSSAAKTKIKAVLLNQAYVVGIGNIYVDEALFRAKIHPERNANSLKDAELKRLYHAIVDTLSEAVEAGGSSIKSYVNGQGEMGMFQHSHQIYGRKDKPCHTCGGPIHKIVVGGRGPTSARSVSRLRSNPIGVHLFLSLHI